MFSTLKAAMVASILVAPDGTALAQSVPESTDPIKVVLNDWTGQLVSAKIAGELLSEMGYSVEYVSAGALPQLVGLANGNLHVQPEVWDNNVGDIYSKAIEAGDLVVLGELGLDAWQDYLYPAYMEEQCPGLPSHTALWDCAQAFAAAETFPNGRLIAYPADWGTMSRDLVTRIGMPFTAIAGGSEGAMMAELQSAYAAKEPIILMWWAPHWVFANLDLRWIEWNEPGGKCDGPDQFAAQDANTICGFEQAKVMKVIWSGVEQQWPAAYRFLELFEQTNADQNAAILEIDQNGRDLDEVVAEWIANNEDRWRPWIEQATQ